MPGKHLYEYAVVRLVPRVEREEFMNVGVIIFSKHSDFLKCKLYLDEVKKKLLCPNMDLEEIEANLDSFEKICSGSPDGGVIAQWETSDRFRWLTAERSASIQTSRPHSGFSDDLDATLERLFEEMVL